MFVIEFTKEATIAFGMLVDAIEGPSFMFVANEARLTVNDKTIKGEYDRQNSVISFIDDGSGDVYKTLAETLPPKTPHYIDGLYGTFQD